MYLPSASPPYGQTFTAACLNNSKWGGCGDEGLYVLYPTPYLDECDRWGLSGCFLPQATSWEFWSVTDMILTLQNYCFFQKMYSIVKLISKLNSWAAERSIWHSQATENNRAVIFCCLWNHLCACTGPKMKSGLNLIFFLSTAVLQDKLLAPPLQ